MAAEGGSSESVRLKVASDAGNEPGLMRQNGEIWANDEGVKGREGREGEGRGD